MHALAMVGCYKEEKKSKIYLKSEIINTNMNCQCKLSLKWGQDGALNDKKCCPQCIYNTVM